MLRTFINSDADFGVFCEDDIRLRKDIKKYLPEIMLQFRRHNLEILLLSCLCPYVPVEVYAHDPHGVFEHPLVYLTYQDNLWGAHMYMLDRKTAQKHLDKYNLAYAEETLVNSNLTHFNPDWTLTKDAERKAAIYPMLSLEAGMVNTDHEFQVSFHKQCFETHFNPILTDPRIHISPYTVLLPDLTWQVVRQHQEQLPLLKLMLSYNILISANRLGMQMEKTT
jgi:hypothetical protein